MPTIDMSCMPCCDQGPAPCIEGVSFTVATVSNKTGDCTCVPDTLDYLGVSPIPCSALIAEGLAAWGSATCPGNPNYYLCCNTEDNQYSFETTTSGITITLVSYSASPPILVYDVSGLGANCGGSGGTFRVTLTE